MIFDQQQNVPGFSPGAAKTVGGTTMDSSRSTDAALAVFLDRLIAGILLMVKCQRRPSGVDLSKM